MRSRKEIWQHAVLWFVITIFACTQIYFGYIDDIKDFLAELLILTACFSLLIETLRLRLGWIMIIGWVLYAASLIADIIDEYRISDEFAITYDIVDDILKIGIVFIGVAFYNAIKEKKWLINNLQLEVEYRRDLEKQLHEVTRIDELTHIGNRRAFFQCYSKLVKKYQHPKLIFIDLDDFKQLNDTQGHQQGDELLIEFAERLTTECADKGVPYRFGGDEFVVLYDGVDGTILMSAVKEKMSETFKHTKVSVSYGCIEINEDESADAQILKVDDLMYENKQQRKSLRKEIRSPESER